MLYGLEPELQKCFETPWSIRDFPRADKYFTYKMEENSSTSEHVLRMSNYYNRLNQVGVNLLDKIVIDRAL